MPFSKQRQKQSTQLVIQGGIAYIAEIGKVEEAHKESINNTYNADHPIIIFDASVHNV